MNFSLIVIEKQTATKYDYSRHASVYVLKKRYHMQHSII